MILVASFVLFIILLSFGQWLVLQFGDAKHGSTEEIRRFTAGRNIAVLMIVYCALAIMVSFALFSESRARGEGIVPELIAGLFFLAVVPWLALRVREFNGRLKSAKAALQDRAEQ